MRKKAIKIDSVTDITALMQHATAVDGDVLVQKGRFIIDGKSLMGLFSIDCSSGVVVEYPETAVEFEEFISAFEV